MEAFMTDRQIIRNVRASFMMEGLCPSKKEEKIGLGILRGEVDVEDVIVKLREKYMRPDNIK